MYLLFYEKFVDCSTENKTKILLINSTTHPMNKDSNPFT